MALGEGKKVLLFYNAHSGNGMFKNQLDYIINRFQSEGYMLIIVRASRGRSIDEVLSEIDPSEYRQIIVSGGDGTINICVNSMISHGIDLPLAIFPAGTANDFAYYFDVPTDVEAMVDIALGDTFKRADVGKVNNRYFINVAAMGALVDVSQKTDPNLKNTIGSMAYYLKGVSEVPNLKPIPMRFITREKTFDEKIYFMVIMNGKSAGGFKKISPESEINDGLLDVIVFKKMSIFDLPPLFFKVLSGKHESNKNVIAFQTDWLRLESPQDVSTDIDGEKGEKFPLEFSVLHNKLQVFVKADEDTEKENDK